MKRHIIYIFLIAFLFSCEKESTQELSSEVVSLIGVWELSATYFSDGGQGGDWVEVSETDSFLLYLNSDLTYVSEADIEPCHIGSYNIENSLLYFYPSDIACNSSKFGFGVENENKLVLIEQDNNCEEICSYRFDRIIAQ